MNLESQNQQINKGGEKMKNIALVIAGGKGQRMGADIPKQFLKVNGKEIIIHTLELFELNDEIEISISLQTSIYLKRKFTLYYNHRQPKLQNYLF